VADIKQQLSRTHLGLDWVLKHYEIKKSTFYGWFDAQGRLKQVKPRARINARRALPSEVDAVITYRKTHPDIGYRKLTWQMLDENIAALS
jgi:hypothetical protein